MKHQSWDNYYGQWTKSLNKNTSKSFSHWSCNIFLLQCLVFNYWFGHVFHHVFIVFCLVHQTNILNVLNCLHSFFDSCLHLFSSFIFSKLLMHLNSHKKQWTGSEFVCWIQTVYFLSKKKNRIIRYFLGFNKFFQIFSLPSQWHFN